MQKLYKLAVCLFILMLVFVNPFIVNLSSYTSEDIPHFTQALPQISTEPLLAIRHIDHDVFNFSIVNPRRYDVDGRLVAGVVPHHITAATLISGFFEQAAKFAEDYDTVIILAPNHAGDLADIVLSYRGWDVGGGLAAHRGFAEDLMAAPGLNTAISHNYIESDHSASIFIPYIYHYLPDTKVAPVLLSRSLSYSDTISLFNWLKSWIENSEETVLLIASIDFSHFLTPQEAIRRDFVTYEAISSRNFTQIHNMSDFYLDSPAALIIFLKYLDAIGIVPQIIDHTDASEFLGSALDETTSYKVIVGAKPDATHVTLAFVGDIMLHEAQLSTDFDHTFSQISPFLQDADLAIGNLETVLGGFFSDFPHFSAPDEFAHALQRAGFNVLSTANNHSLDQGVDGLLRTLDVLHEIGISTFGTYRSQAERDTMLVKEVGGMRFAFLAYTFGTNVQAIPPGREYLINMMNMGLIQADIAAAREIADFVIVMPHMGNEYEEFVRPEFENWVMSMLQAGADVVVASHPHVVQPFGFVDIACVDTNDVRRGFAAYSLGNFVSSQREIPTDAGMVLNLHFERAGAQPPALVGASHVPTWVKFTNISGQREVVVLPVPQTLEAVANGENIGIRQVDLRRMQDVLDEIAALTRY